MVKLPSAPDCTMVSVPLRPLTWMVAPGTGVLSVLLMIFPVTTFWANAAQVKKRKAAIQPVLISPLFFFGISSRIFLTKLNLNFSDCYFFATSTLHHPFLNKRYQAFSPHLHYINEYVRFSENCPITNMANVGPSDEPLSAVQGSELLTNAICRLSGDHDGALSVPCPP